MSTVDIGAVSKRYGSVVALDDVSLSLADGEFFGVLGPSGSGKTTLLRCVAGFIEPEAGTIAIDGEDVRGIPTHRRNIGMVFQNYALFPHMSIFDNIAFGLSVRRRPPAEIAKQVAGMLGLVQLSGYETRRPRELSGGQQQRVALARALVSHPRVLLLDEPLGALDRRLRQQMQIELKQIQREVGITTVFVTHDQEEALTLSDRIAIFSEGRVVQLGAPDAVYDRPRTAFAAEFLGAANFLSGRSAGRRDGLGRVVLGEEGEICTDDPLPPAGAAVTIAVRPEKFTVYPGDAPPGKAAEPLNRLSGRVRQVVYMGSSIIYRVGVTGGEFTVFRQNNDTRNFGPGDAVWLTWSPGHSVVLEA